MDRATCGCGWSQTLKTVVSSTTLKPECVDWRLFRALRMSPSAVKIKASKPPSVAVTPSAAHTVCSRCSRCASVKRVNRRMAQRDWIGSEIFEDVLHASAKRVVDEKSSMVRRMACCAPCVMESASSRITSLWQPAGRFTRFLANILILSRTTAMPRSSEAFSSSTASLARSPSIWRARHSIVVVLPVPGGPLRMMFGMLPPFTTDWSFAIVSSLPTTSLSTCGLYFSTHGCVAIGNYERAGRSLWASRSPAGASHALPLAGWTWDSLTRLLTAWGAIARAPWGD
mmetsp:Transcript_29198/g.87305  ORF Transcript_29198/g.87305 Transcript_29198/m.87305 type:complete len:285 (+) Transcript_29198:295-1149(+)